MVRSKRQRDVILRTNVIQWQRFPVWAKTTLVQGIKRVERIRCIIGEEAKVNSMPPVDGIPEIWEAPDQSGLINGQAGPLKRGATFTYGAELPAQALAIEDEEIMRGILVHEFSHCFYYMRLVLDHIDAGKPVPDLAPSRPWNDEAFDNEHLVNAEDWFGQEDAKNFMKWNQGSAWNYTLPFKKRWQKAGLPVLTPDRNYEINGKFLCPGDLIEHIRRLRVE